MKGRPPIAVIAALLRYEAATGKIFWLVDRGRFKAGDEAGRGGRYRGVTIRHEGTVHRLQVTHVAWALSYGEWPDQEIDHRDLNPSNDRLANLRKAASGQNKANRAVRKLNRTGRKGVGLHKKSGLYRARLGASGKSLGYFRTVEEAHAAYCRAASEAYGEFARG